MHNVINTYENTFFKNIRKKTLIGHNEHKFVLMTTFSQQFKIKIVSVSIVLIRNHSLSFTDFYFHLNFNIQCIS